MGDKNLPLKSVAWQIMAAFAAHSLNIQPGINMAYSTILLPQIMNSGADFMNKTEFNLTAGEDLSVPLIVDKDEASWIASLVTVATPVGSLLTGPLMDRFGRKKTCAFTAVPFIISWTLIATTTVSVYTIYVARILAGVAGGLSTVVIVYVSETSHFSIRPMLLSLTSVFVSFGILLTLILNSFLTWKLVAATCGVCALLSLIFITQIPESPPWIVGFRACEEESEKTLRKAERCLKWLYKNPEDYQNEYRALLKIKKEKSARDSDTLYEKTSVASAITLKSPQAWKPLLILYILFALQQFSGAYLVIFYAVQIFEVSGSVEVNQLTSVITLGCVRFIMAIVSTFLARKYGRRPLLMSSGMGMALTALVAGLWIHFFAKGLIPIICLLVFVLFASYGLSVIPWTLIGELLPLSIRGNGAGFLVAIAYFHMFVTVKLFIVVLDSIGIVLIFILFAAFSFIFVVFVYFKIPETLGKNFQEIENSFK